MGLLDGDLAELFGAAMAGLYGAGRLLTVTTTEDTYGKETRTTEGMDVLVQIDRVTQAMRLAEGYSPEAVQLIILQRNAVGDVVPRPKITDKINAGGRWWAADLVDSDPANSHWAMRGTPTTPPIGG